MITSSGVWRGTKTLVLKTIVDDGIKLAEKSGHKVCPICGSVYTHTLSAP